MSSEMIFFLSNLSSPKKNNFLVLYDEHFVRKIIVLRRARCWTNQWKRECKNSFDPPVPSIICSLYAGIFQQIIISPRNVPISESSFSPLVVLWGMYSARCPQKEQQFMLAFYEGNLRNNYHRQADSTLFSYRFITLGRCCLNLERQQMCESIFLEFNQTHLDRPLES